MDISVIVPFYKGNAYMQQLFACMRENVKQVPSLKTELILVNDSPDCPVQYNEAWVQGFTVRISNNTVNSGIQQSRVNGLHLSEATFVIFLDQDDLLTDDALLSQYQTIGQADIVLANGYNENNNCQPIYRSLAQQRIAATDRFYYTVSNQIASPGQCMIRRSSIPEAWHTRCIGRNGSDDLLLWFMLFHQNAKWAINPQHLYTHKDTGVNLSSDIKKMVFSSMEALQVMWDLGLINKKQERQFLRSRAMAQSFIGASIPQKILICLRYPDIFWCRLQLSLLSRK